MKEEKSYVVSRNFNSKGGKMKTSRNVKLVDKRMKKDARQKKAKEKGGKGKGSKGKGKGSIGKGKSNQKGKGLPKGKGKKI